MQDIENFKTEQIRKGPKKFKVTSSWGVYDAYKWIRKNKWAGIGQIVSEHDFYAVIRQINDIVAKQLAEGRSFILPCRMGKLELRKYKRGVSIVDGVLKNTYPVDWIKTWELWYEDKECKQKGIVMRNEQKYVYKVYYDKLKANYENKGFYKFCLNRFIKIDLKNNIQKGKVDTLW